MQAKPIFRDRFEAGEMLARVVTSQVHDPDSLVLALPRGGVPVGFQIAEALHIELDVFLVRKLGLPGQEELAIGAVASGGIRVLNDNLIEELQLSSTQIDEITLREEHELERREYLYRQGQPSLPIPGRTVILVDDGLATGASMKAASQAVRLEQPGRLIVAVPVAAEQTCEELRTYVDQILCMYTPTPFVAVGVWYEDFAQTADDEVQQLLRRAKERDSARSGHA